MIFDVRPAIQRAKNGKFEKSFSLCFRGSYRVFTYQIWNYMDQLGLTSIQGYTFCPKAPPPRGGMNKALLKIGAEIRPSASAL